jgi:hypothetical protein
MNGECASGYSLMILEALRCSFRDICASLRKSERCSRPRWLIRETIQLLLSGNILSSKSMVLQFHCWKDRHSFVKICQVMLINLNLSDQNMFTPERLTFFFLVFANLRKATISFVVTVHPFVRVYPHGTTRFPLDGNWRNLVFEYSFKSIGKISVSLKSDKKNVYFT